MASRGPWIDHFGDNFLWSNATLIIKGMAPYGVVALGEIDRVCERLRLRQQEPHAWWEEWGRKEEVVARRGTPLNRARHGDISWEPNPKQVQRSLHQHH